MSIDAVNALGHPVATKKMRMELKRNFYLTVERENLHSAVAHCAWGIAQEDMDKAARIYAALVRETSLPLCTTQEKP